MSTPRRCQVQGPYDLVLSLSRSDRFHPLSHQKENEFRTAVRADGLPAVMDVCQAGSRPAVLKVTGYPEEVVGSLRPLAEWMLFAELDLRPFYEMVETHDVLGNVVRRLNGLKPTRPPSLFEMAVTAVTEQQISMAAAYQIRSRVVEAFGDPVEVSSEDEETDLLHVFPAPDTIASAPFDELKACGLSRRKAEYIRGLARAIVEEDVDLEKLRDLPNDQVRSVITDLRGFGPWSADYILVRGLGRLDCVPVDDLGVRTVVGHYLGDGSRMAPEAVQQALAPFEPYRGLLAFYLLAHWRVEPDANGEDET